MSLHWYQSEAIDNPSLWMAEDGEYSLSAHRCGKRWGFTVWMGDQKIKEAWWFRSLAKAQEVAEHMVIVQRGINEHMARWRADE